MKKKLLIVFDSMHHDSMPPKVEVVTKTDYETVIKQSNPNIKSVGAWGGEDNLPLSMERYSYRCNQTQGLLSLMQTSWQLQILY